MRCNLIIEINEITVRDYTIVEEEGLIDLTGNRPDISFEYEDDEEKPGKHILVIKGKTLKALFSYADFAEIPVKIIS